LCDKAMAFPYGVIEGEPVFPLTNFSPSDVEKGVIDTLALGDPRGIMANAQTHCLQLPHTYLFAHFVHGGTAANTDLVRFAEDLLSGLGPVIARGWQAIGERNPATQRIAADELKKHIGESHRLGRLSGLLFRDADRFLTDLVMNLELRAELIEMKDAIDGHGKAAVNAVCRVLNCLRPYQQRLGFNDAYSGPLFVELNQQLERLNDDSLNVVLRDFKDWRNLPVRNGIVPRLVKAMEVYCRE
jgi:hypothetical protein